MIWFRCLELGAGGAKRQAIGLALFGGRVLEKLLDSENSIKLYGF